MRAALPPIRKLSWGPFLHLEEDQPGLAYLLHLHRFFTDVVPFSALRPAPELVVDASYEPGHTPLALATADRNLIAAYLPAGGKVSLHLPRPAESYRAQWFNPCTGELTPAGGDDSSFAAPQTTRKGYPQDWVLVLR